MDTKAMRSLSYGLFVLTAKDGDKDNGCIINTAIQAASEPNQMSICVNKANYTHDMILKTGEFNVSVISEAASFDLFAHFGFNSGRDMDKFADFSDCKRAENGLFYINKGTCAYFSVKVKMRLDLGSHTMFIGEIEDMEVISKDAPATYAYYHSNIKPQKKESKPEEAGKVVWRCTICGYEYEGDPIPDDFICPLCKHPASDFERIVK